MSVFFRAAMRRAIQLTLAMILSSCNDLAVFVTPSLPSSLAGMSDIEVNSQGFLQLSWQTTDTAHASRYEVYEMEISEGDPLYAFSDKAERKAPLTSEVLTIESAKDRPKAMGKLLATVKDLNFVFNHLLVPNHTYAVQIVQKARRPSAASGDVLLVKVGFDNFSATSASQDESGVKLSWNAVPGANRYVVYADESMTTSLGETTTTTLTLQSKAMAQLSSYYIRAFRGELASSDLKRIDISHSDTKPARVEAISANGWYKTGDTLDFNVIFSKPVSTFGIVSLPIIVGTNTRQAIYRSGSSTTTLHFTYTVQAGDYADRVASDQVLSGTFIDNAGIEISGELPAAGTGKTLQETSQIAIDAQAPTSPSLVSFSQPIASSGTLSAQWTSGSDPHFDHDEAKICTHATCDNGCLASNQTTNSTISFTGLSDGIYYACVRSLDSFGQASNWVASALTASVDTVAPVITRVYALTADGAYKEGQNLSLAIEFSEPVLVTGGNDIGLLLKTGAVNHSASYQSGSGTRILTFAYSVQVGDTSSDLNYFATTALSLGSSGSISDVAGSAAVLTLPALSATESLAGQSQILLDTKSPTNPSNIVFTSPSPAPTTALDLSWTASTDTNFKQHNVKLCSANDCISSCLAGTAVTGSTATLNGVNGSTYYACVQGEDNLGHLSSWQASALSLTVNTTIPAITLIKAINADGIYKEGQTLDFNVQFNDVVRVTGNPKITLATGGTNHDMVYSAGDNSTSLTFTYTVHADDATSHLNYLSTNALYLNGGTLKSVSGNNADLTLPPLGGANALASQSQIALDTEAPTAPGSVNFSSANPSASTSLAFSWTASTDTNFKQHNIKLCTDSFCSTGCVGANSVTGTSGSAIGTASKTYYACVRGEDLVGHLGAWVASSSTVNIDTSPPTVTSVTSSASDGYYTVGQSLSIAVRFSEPIILSGGASPVLTLATGSTQELATYTSLSSSDTLLFTYTVQAGDVAADLDYAAVTALSLVSGSIQDTAGNNADLTLPSPGSATSLGGQKAIVIDTTAPTAPTSPGFGSTISYTSAISLTWGASTDTNFQTHNVKLCTSNDCSAGCLSSSVSASSPASLVGINGSTYYGCVQGKDAAGLTSAWVSSLNSVQIDSNQPTIMNVTSSQADGLYKVGATIPVSVTFSKVVYVTGGGGLGLLLETGATDRTAAYASGHGTDTLTFSYTVQAGDTSSDLEYQSVNALTLGGATIKDSGNNDAELQLPPLQSSISLGGQKAITIDTTAPIITSVDSPQSNGSYKLGDSITIRVHFSEAVMLTGSAGFGLLLETGSTDRTATYVSGDGSSTLSFSYTVQAADTSSDLEYQSTTALTLGGGAIKDSAGNDAVLTLPALNSANSLAGQQAFVIDTTAPVAPVISSPIHNSYSTALITTISGTGEANAILKVKDGTTSIGTTTVDSGGSWSIILGNSLAEGSHNLTATATDAAGNVSPASSTVTATVDTTAPVAPSSVGFASPLSNATSFSMSWANSTDTNFQTHNVKICTVSDCSTDCTSVSTANASPGTMTGVNGTTYYGCVQGLDLAGNSSAWINSTGTLTVDTTAPTLINVTSSQADGLYKAGAVIPIQVKFSEPVYVTSGGSLSLLLETGATDHAASYSSGSGSNTLTFSYTVQAGDTSSDLEYQSTGALSLGSGSIKDAAGNDAILTLPALNSASSLAGQKALVIDTTAPSAPVFTSPATGSALTSPIYSVSGTAEANATLEVFESGNSLGLTTVDSGGSWSLTLDSPYMNGTFTFSAIATDPVGNASIAGTTAVTVAIPPPTVYAGGTIYSSSSSRTLVGSASNAVSYQWSLISGPGTASFGSPTALITTVSLSTAGTYYLRLKATNIAGVSATSDLKYAYDTTAPTFAGLTHIWQKSATQVLLFWDSGNDDITYTKDLTYEICVSSTLGSCASNFVVSYTVPINTFDYKVSGLTAGTIYEFMVRAKDKAGNPSTGTVVKTSAALTNIKQISSGATHVCALLNDTNKRVKCWGANNRGQLGNGSTTNSFTPVFVSGLTNVKAVAAGGDRTCALLNDNTVKCWGSNDHGQLGNNSTTASSTPVVVSGVSNVSSLVPGKEHSCAILASGGMQCWGYNNAGQLGDGSTTDRLTAVAVSGTGASPNDVVAAAAADGHTCAKFSSGDFKCWGYNNHGQIGNGTTSASSTPQNIASLSGQVSAFSLGGYSSCAVLNSGAVQCWGSNSNYQLGDGTTNDRTTPTNTFITSGASNIALSSYSTCIRLSDNTARCWGRNNYGQLGRGNADDSAYAYEPLALGAVTDLVQGNSHACATFSDNSARCWGSYGSGSLGSGNDAYTIKTSTGTTSTGFYTPYSANIANVSTVGSGQDYTCALITDGTVKCWGYNNNGQLGNADYPFFNLAIPTAVTGLSNATQLGVGRYHSCAVLSDGTAKCWGQNNYGQLGNGTSTSTWTPVTVSGLSGIASMATNGSHSCALLNDATVRCWGLNDKGQLGNGTTTNSMVPVDPGLSNVIRIALGESHSCALIATGQVRCWGDNSVGEIGDGTTTNRLAPVNSGVTSAVEISSSFQQTCALITYNGTVKCWGYNNHGQLGDGTKTNQKSPVAVAGLSSIDSILVSIDYTCAAVHGASVECWGSNAEGYIGTPTSLGSDVTSIIIIKGIGTILGIGGGGYNACTVLTDNNLRCWGRAKDLALGADPGVNVTSLPAQVVYLGE